jgi:F-box and WD-40 domain protein CDC4
MDLANSPVDSIDYLSASTLAPPSPSETEHQTAMATSQVTPKHKRELSSAPVQPYATIGKLSYAPATQTTVVTTTTTTTTSFPPLLLKEPRHLHDRDPKQYPLAASPTPASIRNFCFDIAGESTCFEETDDLEGSLLQVSLVLYTRHNSQAFFG